MMADDSSEFSWGIAAVALVGAVVLLGVGIATTGVPSVPVLNPDAQEEETRVAEIDFRPNPTTMTVQFEGGGPVSSTEVYVNVEGAENRTWAAYDVDLQPGQPLDAGEEITVEQWSEGDSIRVYYQGEVLAVYDP